MKVRFGLEEDIKGSVSLVQDRLGHAGGNLEYVARKLWVRVDELKGGRSEGDVIDTLSRDSAAVKIPKFLDEGSRDLDQAVNEAGNMAQALKKVQRDMLAWKSRYNDVVLRGKKPSGGLERWVIKMAQDLDEIRGEMYDLQGI